MPSSELSRLVALVRIDVSEECIASIIRVEGIREPEGGILHSHCRENLRSYMDTIYTQNVRG
jgi:hypothetical protein